MTVAQNVLQVSLVGLAGGGIAYLHGRWSESRTSKKLAEWMLPVSAVTAVVAGSTDSIQEDRALFANGSRIEIACQPELFGTGYQRADDLPVQRICFPHPKPAVKTSFYSCAARPFATLADGRGLYNCRNKP